MRLATQRLRPYLFTEESLPSDSSEVPPREEMKAMATHTDPVCGMKVGDPTTAPQSTYEGNTYYFCGHGCKTRFDESPQRYAGKNKES